MGSRNSRNPLAFTSLPVTIITVFVYLSLAVGLLYVHLIVPSAPSDPTPVKGINITEAWRDLQTLSGGFHPYNSRRNDWVRSWLLERIDYILNENDVEFGYYEHDRLNAARRRHRAQPAKGKSVIVFNDLTSNVTFSSPPASPLNAFGFGGPSVYFEGTNIIVYIRGSEDGESDWWMDPEASRKETSRGVLINAHYDSVSTSFGATDDGVGVVSVLQLIKYFSTSGNRPKRGLVALLNNGEEDFLNGARVFMQNPISRFPDTFLNLEGAGAGGRAILFRSTDTEVTQAYKDSPYPFGTVLAADSFNRGLVRSQTDYIVFNGEMGLRGLDIAFFEPRARYHTAEDSARWTSRDSLWHMLSAALATTEALTSDTKTDFDSDHGSKGVWFDLLGRGFALVRLHTMFAISVTLLVVAPVILIALSVILRRVDKWYLFARKARSDPLDPRAPDDETVIQLNGWRGIFRYPFAFVLASAAVAGLAFLLAKINPYIIYSSQYAVWSMMLSAWFVVAWFILRGADFMRPTALHRAHAFGWLFFLSWVILALVTIGENNFKIAGSYFMVIYFASISIALLISYVEFFALPRRNDYVQTTSRSRNASRPLSSHRGPASMRSGLVPDAGERSQSSGIARDTDDPTETTSLLSKRQNRYGRRSRRRSLDDESDDDEQQSIPKTKAPFGDEQGWSGSLPSWLWILQFLLFGPITIILVGQVGLFAASAMSQTPADGSEVLLIYGIMGLISVLLLLPVSPFLHRFSYQIPTFLFFLFVGTTLYNLLAFPFSEQNRLKVFFVQDVDLASGITKVSLTGLDGYVQQIISSIPSAAGQHIECSNPPIATKKGLRTCKWNGLAPNVVPSGSSHQLTRFPSQTQYRTWVSVNATRLNCTQNEAVFRIVGQNTRACRMFFDSPISSFNVSGAAPFEEHLPSISKYGTKEIRLWGREWSKPWTVRVRWEEEGKEAKRKPSERTRLEGRAVCLWSDANERGTIPALDEVKEYLPVWAAVSKLEDGLVQGYKSFKV